MQRRRRARSSLTWIEKTSMRSIASGGIMPFKNMKFLGTLLGATGRCLLLGCLVASGGCGGTTQSTNEGPSSQDAARIDWGMSLLAGGKVDLVNTLQNI